MYIKRTTKKKIASILVIFMCILIVLGYAGLISGKVQHIALSIVAGIAVIGTEIPETPDYIWTEKKKFWFYLTVILVLAALYVAIT